MHNRKGITIIEIITVVIVISILAAVALPQYMSAIERGQVGRVRARVDVIRKAEAAYFSTNMRYTDSLALLANDVPEANAGLQDASGGRSDGEWTYSIAESTDQESYTVTATRKAGVVAKYSAKTVEIDKDGQLIGTGTHPLGR